MALFIQELKDISKDDVAKAGGKGASLGEMTQAGFPVPPGFVVLTGAFEKFLEAADINEELAAEFNSVGSDQMHSAQEASRNMQTLIQTARMPEEIAAALKHSFKELRADPYSQTQDGGAT